MRTILYARYSSELQNTLSTIDQIASLRERAEREGWTIVDSFADEEISGRAGISEMQRPGLNAMLNRIERGDIDQVLAEATDRIARHSGDAHAVREHLEHFGARLFTLADGHVDEITGTIKGLMDSRFLKDLADRIRRGQRGQHGRGFNAGGLAYGYNVVKKIGDDGELVRGLLEVNQEEAAIVRRIFTETLAGVSARSIVKALNDEGVPSPSGKLWATNVIHGDRIRANGILRNNLYRGVMVYGRTRRAYHPKTRKYVARVNPVSEWRFAEVPHLRIISDEQWAAIEAVYSAFDGDIRTKKKHPKRLLSGLGRCGVCGGTWTVISPSKWGCSTAKGKQACINTRTISTGLYEQRTLGQLKETLLDPDAIRLFVERYNIGIQKRRAEAVSNRAPLERRAADLRARISRLVDAIADGAGEFQEVKDRLRTARADLADVDQQLKAMADCAPIALPDDLADRYRTYIAELDVALATEGLARERAASAIRELIDTLTLTPNPHGRGVIIEVTGRMATIVNLAKSSE